ncbi:septum formation initiator family protein [Aerococcaceae bacterium WGS1372]
MQPSSSTKLNRNEKVVYLPTHGKKNRKMAETISNQQKQAEKFSKRTLGIIVIGIVGVSLSIVPLIQAMNESQTIMHTLEETKKAEKEAMQENIQVQDEYKHMQDPDYLADVARRDYYYSKPGEIIFELKDNQE